MTIDVITMGCRLNGYESDVIADNLRSAGMQDVVVINSCAVTAEAVRQAKQHIRKIAREHPEKKIIVTGCAAQTEPETFADMPQVAKVVGNHEKLLPQTYHNLLDPLDTEKILVNDIMSITETAGHLKTAFDSRSRAYLQIQNGCNHRCTFCIIPFGRGNSRSVPVGVIIDHIKQAVDAGIQEVVLTGVDITSWGGDLPATPCLGYLTDKILKLVPDLPRLRLSSIDSIEVSDILFEIMAYEKRFMPHLHLSLQAGDDMILKRMKRRHNTQQALEFTHKLKAVRPEFSFGADIIAGFPTETEDMFENTKKFLQEINIVYGHIFPFSPRNGTPAAKMPQLDKNTIKARAKKLREVCEQNLEHFSQSLVGTWQQVVVEEASAYGQKGRCENFALVQMDQIYPVGSIQKVYIRNYQNGILSV